MATLNVFFKNLRVVFRSPFFFIFLFVLPLLLITSTTFLLNSSQYDNIRMGVIGYVDFDGFHQNYIRRYESLSDCKRSIAREEVSFCMEKEGDIYNVYYDNYKPALSLAIKENLLQFFLTEQNRELHESKNNLLHKAKITRDYIESIEETLDESEKKIITQKQKLQSYKSDLEKFTLLFDIFYNNYNSYNQEKNEIQYEINSLIDQLSIIENKGGELPLETLYLIASLKGNLLEYRRKIIKEEGFFHENLNEFKYKLTQLNQDLENAIQDLDMALSEISKLRTNLYIAKHEIFTMISNADIEGEVQFIGAFPEKTSQDVYAYFPIIITLIISFTSVILSNLFIIRSYSSKSKYREFLSPVSDATFLIGDFLICLLFVLFETSVIFMIGMYMDFYTIELLLPYASVILIFSPIFILIGIILGYLIKSNILSMLISIFFLLFTFIISDIFIPFPLLGNFMQVMVSANPFYLYKFCFDRIILYKMPLEASSFTIAFFYIFILLIASIISKKINRKKAFR